MKRNKKCTCKDECTYPFGCGCPHHSLSGHNDECDSKCWGEKKSKKKKNIFKLGDTVEMVNPNPVYGLGDVNVGDIGKVVTLTGDNYEVNFPSQKYWAAESKDLRLVKSLEKKHEKTTESTKISKGSRVYTITISIEEDEK